MGFVQYFIESNVPFGGISWAMVVVWALTLGFGIYLLRSYRDNNPIRVRFARQVGTIATALSAVGLVLLLLKFLNVPGVEWRLWSWLVALASIGYAAWAAYQYNSKLPAQIASARPTRAPRRVAGPGGGAKTYPATGTPATPRPPREPRPVATTTRREARRDKKRKSR